MPCFPTLYKIWAKSINSRLSYWRFSTFFRRSILQGSQISGRYSEVHGPNFTKLLEDIGPSLTLTEFVSDFGYFSIFETRTAQRWLNFDVENQGRISHCLTAFHCTAGADRPPTGGPHGGEMAPYGSESPTLYGCRATRKRKGPINQSINQSLFANAITNKQQKVWQAARTGNSPTKLATLDRKTER